MSAISVPSPAVYIARYVGIGKHFSGGGWSPGRQQNASYSITGRKDESEGVAGRTITKV